MEDITEADRRTMTEIRQTLVTFKDSPYLKWDYNLIRWIHGWDNNMEEIIRRLTDHLSLRAMLKLDDITDISYRKDFHPVLQQFYPWGLAGVDKQGNVIVIESMGKSDPKGLLPVGRCSEFLRSRILDTEYISHLVREQEKKLKKRCGLVLLVDYDGMNSDHLWKPIMNIYITALNILQDNNPDLLVKVLCINSPTLLQAAYAIVKPFLAQKTRDKIEILSSSWKNRVFQLISEDQLPRYWGGTLKGVSDNYADVIPGGPVPNYHKFKPGTETPADSELKELCVGRRSVEFVSVVVHKANEVLRWYFKCDSEEIIFGIRYKSPTDTDSDEGEEVVPIWKLNVGYVPEFGTYQCVKSGVYDLVFDNSFSVLRSKTIKYKVEVIPPHD